MVAPIVAGVDSGERLTASKRLSYLRRISQSTRPACRSSQKTMKIPASQRVILPRTKQYAAPFQAVV